MRPAGAGEGTQHLTRLVERAYATDRPASIGDETLTVRVRDSAQAKTARIIVGPRRPFGSHRPMWHLGRAGERVARVQAGLGTAQGRGRRRRPPAAGPLSIALVRSGSTATRCPPSAATVKDRSRYAARATPTAVRRRTGCGTRRRTVVSPRGPPLRRPQRAKRSASAVGTSRSRSAMHARVGLVLA